MYSVCFDGTAVGEDVVRVNASTILLVATPRNKALRLVIHRKFRETRDGAVGLIDRAQLEGVAPRDAHISVQ